MRELVKELPPENEILIRGARACGHIANQGWRLGVTEEDGKRAFDEGRAFAEQAGDTAVLAELYGGYGAVRGVCLGYANDYVTYANEAVRLADRTDDTELQFAMRGAYLVPAYVLAGRNEEVCEVAERTTRENPDDPLFGAHYVGLSPRYAMWCHSARCAAIMGHREKTKRMANEEAHLLSVERFQELAVFAQYIVCDSLILDGDSASAAAFAQNAMVDVDQVQTGMARVTANMCMGRACLVNQEAAKADLFLANALQISDETHAAGMFRGLALAHLSSAQLAQNNVEAALKTAEEAVDYSRPRGLKWDPEPWFAWARALIAAGEQSAAREAIDEAQRVIDETRAKSFQPFLHECRARFAEVFDAQWTRDDELRETHRLFVKLGATGHAERVARMLEGKAA
jgi:hypothetical protein